MGTAWLQRIGTATPRHDIHDAFIAYARSLLASERERGLFDRMAQRTGIERRHAVLAPGRLEAGEIDAAGFYKPGHFPGTAARMRLFETEALRLALQAVQALAPEGELPGRLARVTHLVLATCTGLHAPGLDVALIDALGLPPTVQRTVVGFMGCSAALPALRLAQHAVCSQPDATVLVVNVELCSLHLRESHALAELLSFVLFGDAASAALVGGTAEGAELLGFHSQLLPGSRELLTWRIGDRGFEMHLSGELPARIYHALHAERQRREGSPLLFGQPVSAFAHWAVHAGGRTVLDAVADGLALPADALAPSRAVLAAVGNVSSATVMFVLQRVLAQARPGSSGMALAFGPGLSAEAMRFRVAGLAS